MSWPLLIALPVLLSLTLVAVVRRRVELRALSRTRLEVEEARRRGSHRAELQYPAIDLAKCIGCGSCVRACPEDGVLGIVHGQAAVVHGARCVGHARCAEVCPTGAIAVTLADLGERRDIPALTDQLEVKGHPGLYLAGEVTGHALIRTAIAQGTRVADEIARRPAPDEIRGEIADVAIVGAGPAGLACALEARRRGLRAVVIEQEEELGGTVARYPRRKLVMTQPVELPLHGRLRRTEYRKEELVELWRNVAREHRLDVRTGTAFEGLERESDGTFRVRTTTGPVSARHVCVAIGRRGTPRRLGVPGEDLHKVAYHLVDAGSYADRRVLVVGGGDSAVETALGLAEQPGNEVHLSYRQREFARLRTKNEARLKEAAAAGRVRLLAPSLVLGIEPESVRLEVDDGDGGRRETVLANDEVFVHVGGVPPFDLLERCGVSFAPEDRDPPSSVTESRSGLSAALATTLVVAVAALLFAIARGDYYRLAEHSRPDSARHDALRPSGGTGLGFALLAAACLAFNLAYLLRRSRAGTRVPGTLRAWMTGHVASGVLTLVLLTLHAGLRVGDSPGGHAYLALVVVVGAGAVGRWIYALVPRAANGRVAELDEVRARLDGLSASWDRGSHGFGERVREAVSGLIDVAPWRRSLPRRLAALALGQRRLRRTLDRLRGEGRRAGIAADELGRILALARQAHRLAIAAAHYEDVRGVLASWRYLHRWLAILTIAVAVLHVVTAIRYADLRFEDIWLLGSILGGR